MRLSFIVPALVTLAALAIAADGASAQAVGDSYGGIVKQSASSATMAVNGIWDSADLTGNAAVDHVFGMFDKKLFANPSAINALEETVADVKTNPATYVTSNGDLLESALRARIHQRFSGVPGVNDAVIAAIWPTQVRVGPTAHPDSSAVQRGITATHSH